MRSKLLRLLGVMIEVAYHYVGGGILAVVALWEALHGDGIMVCWQ